VYTGGVGGGEEWIWGPRDNRLFMVLMSDLAGPFKEKLGQAVAASTKDSAKPLEDLLREQRAQQRAVDLEPFPDPDDRYEAMANDYGQFLFRHYETACSLVQAEIDQLKNSA
jgi:hypothetical protein